MITLFITLLIIAAASGFLLGSIIAGGARSKLEVKTIILSDTILKIIREYQNTDNLRTDTMESALQTIHDLQNE